jgi:hypothetical protein
VQFLDNLADKRWTRHLDRAFERGDFKYVSSGTLTDRSSVRQHAAELLIRGGYGRVAELIRGACVDLCRQYQPVGARVDAPRHSLGASGLRGSGGYFEGCFGLSMGDGLSGRSVESGSFRSPFSSMLMLQSAVSPDIASPALTLMVQITWSLKLRLPRPGKLLLRLGVLRGEGETGKHGQQSNHESGKGSGHGPTVANRWPFAEIHRPKRFVIGIRAYWPHVWPNFTRGLGSPSARSPPVVVWHPWQ